MCRFQPLYLLLRDGGATMSAFYCYFFSCGCISRFASQVTYCHVIFYCLTRDTEDSFTAMRMLSTTDSRIIEMAIVGQPFNL